LSLKRLVIAIDGPAASGKSTTAKLVAEKLGYLHVDTGAMYRVVALQFLRYGVELIQKKRIEELLNRTHIKFMRDNNRLRVLLGDEDVTEEIRSSEVTRVVSSVATVRAVREAMVREQQAMGAEGGVVLEGRDIGTVVFPNADLKIFMVASIDARAKRRRLEMEAKGDAPNIEELKSDIRHRDEKDSSRDESPLRKADDAIELDTSELTIAQQVDFIVKKAKEIQAKVL
jgi:CMP/dCMP kinase